MKRLSLQLRITLLSAVVLIGVTGLLTLIAVKNAKQTYTNQFEMNFGDEFGIRINDNEVSFQGEGMDVLNDILDFANQWSGNDVPEQKETLGVLSEAGQEFTRKSIWVMLVVVAIGIVLIYFLVEKALYPVRRLSQVAKEVNQNNLYQKLEVPEAKDEISSLTCSFNNMLERLNMSFTMQKNFAANAAHELRTPLSTMKAGIQVLEMDEEPSVEDYKETVEIIKKNTQRMIQVVDDLLSITKQEACDFTHYITLTDMFEEIVQELTEEASTNKVILQIQESEGSLKGNEILLYRAFFNLVQNAVKYNRPGGSVILSGKVCEQGVRITISDTGIGIPKESLTHIFEPFYRVDKARSKKIGGSGLGLTIVKDIIEKHKGQIRVDSKEGEGTTFLIELPN